ncbi:hypothetical protein Arad_12288 (plasmid) [Rhizobium rhizogenes K84]|uniref:Uncharacterized protein n=1 Tax=Rhizobium rhizogenes (strain K84 / ATCC BAA-868) TaxID=311403 RepID=B9JQ77_RHIR8|nr:hypothetical protein Arad_12288 [Rhizobium rhizogenes K84]
MKSLRWIHRRVPKRSNQNIAWREPSASGIGAAKISKEARLKAQETFEAATDAKWLRSLGATIGDLPLSLIGRRTQPF